MSDTSAIFEASQNLPTVSAVVQALIKSFDDPEVDIDSIAKQLIKDQTLSARVLRLANTPAYGGSRKIASIGDAVLVLGFNALRTLVLSCGITSSIKTPREFNIQEFWLQSFKVAATASWLAKVCRKSADIAFTVGLLHNLGDVLIFTAFPDKGAQLQRMVWAGQSRISSEMQLLGCSYADVGAELARRWRFPDMMVEAIQEQESNPEHAAVPDMALLLQLAKQVVQSIDAGVPPERLVGTLSRVVLDQLHLNPDILLTRYSEMVEVGRDAALFAS